MPAGEFDKHMVLSVEENFAKAKPKNEKCLEDLFIETFGRKAAATLNGRAGCFLLFARWLRSMGQKVFPMTHEKCHAYVRACRLEGAPATRAYETRKSWNVAHYLLGLKGDMKMYNSPQIDGAIHASYQKNG